MLPRKNILSANQRDGDSWASGGAEESVAFRDNSYIRRTTTRTTNRTTATRSDVVEPDFLNLITAIEELYSQRDVMEIQQLDGHNRTQVGLGQIFEVSTVNAESTRPSETIADSTVRHNQAVILKRPPAKLFESDGRARAGGAAAKFVMELRILSHPFIRSSNYIVTLLGIGWEYARSVRLHSSSIAIRCSCCCA